MTRKGLVGVLMLLASSSLFLGWRSASATGTPEPPLVATPQAECGPGSSPETDLQGRVPPADYASGRAAEGYTCNAVRVGGFDGGGDEGTLGGFKVERHIDTSGRECAYYDTSLLLGTDLFDGGVGTNVLDMTDPANPVLTDTLTTPAMLSPHESLVLSQERGLLVAVLGNPGVNAGVIDVYDIGDDCRSPVLLSSSPVGVFGHESGLSPDGLTFYAASPATQTLVAVDLTNPSLPTILTTYLIDSHGLSIGADGNRAYVGAIANGMVILDTSEVQAREPLPQITEVSQLDWTSRSIPQNAIPITINDHPYVVEIDEFGSGTEVGAGRIIDIGDETSPRVVSNLRLEVHQPEHFGTIGDDPGTGSAIQGYAGHYCNVPTRVDPTIVACSMILSGLRVFDISDPLNPVEVAYHNVPTPDVELTAGSYAMASPSFVPERNEIWYSDGFSGFHVVRLTNGVWPAAPDPPTSLQVDESDSSTTAAPTSTAPAGETLPATGSSSTRLYLFVGFLSAVAALAMLAPLRSRRCGNSAAHVE